MPVRARVLLTGAAAALMITTGCSGAPDAPATNPTAQVSAAPPSIDFGKTYSYPDGSTITLSATQFHPQHPGEFGPAFVLLKGTVTNGASAPAWADNLIDATAGGKPAQKVGLTDPAVKLPNGMLLPGQSQTFAQPYAVQDAAAEFVVKVSQPRVGSGQTAGAIVVFFHGTPAAG